MLFTLTENGEQLVSGPTVEDITRPNPRLVYPGLVPGLNCPPDSFVRIEGYPKYEINVHGEVRRGREQSLVKHYLGTSGYVCVTLIDEDEYRAPVKLHRLLALTFLPHPSDTDALTINHRDGNKENNKLWNLEWATNSENVQHSFDTGLNDGHVKEVLVMNITTRDVEEYPSISKCARFFGVAASTIRDPIRNYRGIRPYKGCYLKYKNDSRKWPEDDGSALNRWNSQAVLVKDILTGIITKYESMQETGVALGCSTASIWNQVKYPQPREYKGKLIRLDSIDISWDTISTNITPIKNRTYRLTNLYTKEVKDGLTVSGIARITDAPTASVYTSIRRDTPLRGYRLELCA